MDLVEMWEVAMGWFRKASKYGAYGVDINVQAKAPERQWRWIDCKNQSEALRVLDKLAKAGLSYELSVVYQAHMPERSSRDWFDNKPLVYPEVKAGLKWYVKVDQAQLDHHVQRDTREQYVEDLKL
jgi:hypothetical protein